MLPLKSVCSVPLERTLSYEATYNDKCLKHPVVKKNVLSNSGIFDSQYNRRRRNSANRPGHIPRTFFYAPRANLYRWNARGNSSLSDLAVVTAVGREFRRHFFFIHFSLSFIHPSILHPRKKYEDIFLPVYWSVGRLTVRRRKKYCHDISRTSSANILSKINISFVLGDRIHSDHSNVILYFDFIKTHEFKKK